MRRLLNLFASYFRINLTRFVSYRLETGIWLIGSVLPPVIMLSVWQSATLKAGGVLEGFTRGGIAAYFIAVMLVSEATHAWAVFLWESYVREGYLSSVLVRPNAVAFQDFGENMAFKAVVMPVMIVTAVGLAFTFKPEMPLVPWAIVAFVPALILGFAIRYVVDWITATTSALHLTKVDAVNSIYFLVLLMFSGQLAPINLLPSSMRIVADCLPFRWMIDFPVQLIMGRLSPHDVLVGFGAQAGWLTGVLLLNSITWRHGMRRYTAVGI